MKKKGKVLKIYQCEVTSNNGAKVCGKLAKYEVTCRWNKKSFFVCKKHIPAYEFQDKIRLKSSFIIKELEG